MAIDTSKLTVAQKRKLEKILRLGLEGLPSLLEHLFEIEEKLPAIEEVINKVKGEKGDKGADGLHGRDGKNGENGKPYILTDFDKRQIASQVKVITPERVIEKRTETVIKEIPVIKETIKETIRHDLAPQEVRNLLELLQEDERFDAKHIRNLPELIKRLNPPNGPMLHPVALSNLPDVSVVGVQVGQTIQWNGVNWVPGNGSGGFTSVETPVGAINGANTIFAVVYVPLWINLNGLDYFQNNGYTYANGIITIDPSIIPVTGSILRSINNGVAVTDYIYLTDANGNILTDSSGNPLIV